MWQAITSGLVWHGVICNRNKNGSHYWVATTVVPFIDATGAVYRYVSIRTDITAIKQAEEELHLTRNELRIVLEQQTAQFEKPRAQLDETELQLLLSEKLAAIGQLAARVSHEINNPIGYVNSNFGALERYIDNLHRLIDAYATLEQPLACDSPARTALARIKEDLDFEFLRNDISTLMSDSKKGISRVRQIVADLRRFSGVDSMQNWEEADMHKSLESALNVISSAISYKTKVVKEYCTMSVLECNPAELNQVFMSLLVNAADAIGDSQHGIITLRTGSDHESVWLEVEDTGCGMLEQNLKYILDPFFTTKPVGAGIGLGLSLSYGIVKKHGGSIQVRSTPNVGSVFRVLLPRRRPL